MGMDAFLAVARGSAQEPKFIHMKYSVDNPKKRIAIIGKGITFDSGGLDIKPASSMLTMKDDMSAAACVLGVLAMKEFLSSPHKDKRPMYVDIIIYALTILLVFMDSKREIYYCTNTTYSIWIN